MLFSVNGSQVGTCSITSMGMMSIQITSGPSENLNLVNYNSSTGSFSATNLNPSLTISGSTYTAISGTITSAGGSGTLTGPDTNANWSAGGAGN